MHMTGILSSDREEKVDFTDMYYVSNLVVIYKKK